MVHSITRKYRVEKDTGGGTVSQAHMSLNISSPAEKSQISEKKPFWNEHLLLISRRKQIL